MRNDESSASFLSRWMRPRRASIHDDPADLGTAFGLDLSMEGGLPHPVDAAAGSVQAGAEPAEGWLARLRRRAA